jgi:hypothetical protein
MAESQKKSKRQSGGKQLKPPKSFQIYLDENLCNCKPIIQTLNLAKIVFHKHLEHFPAGTPDHEWLPFIGINKYLLVTLDKRLRFNELERTAIRTHNIQCCEFSGGSIGAIKMAEALRIALPKMIRLKKHYRKYYVASISPSGEIKIVWDYKKDKTKIKIKQIPLPLAPK